jgi:hypothetical protein
MAVRILFWANIVALSGLGPFMVYDFLGQTYYWWAGIESTWINPHSPTIFLVLIVFAVSSCVLVANLCLIASRLMSKRRLGAFYVASGAFLSAGLAFSIWMPKDALGAAAVAVLGPGNRGGVLLHNSIATGRMQTAKQLLAEGALLPSDESIVYIGATFGKLDMIKWGIARGEDINAISRRGYAPLAAAIVNGNLEAADYLLTSGAKATEVDKDKLSALRARRGSY